MAKKLYFELGLLLKAMQDNDADRTIDRLRRLTKHYKGGDKCSLDIFPAYMLALNWLACRTDPRSPRHALQYLDLATFDAGVNFNFFDDLKAREQLVNYIVENALKLNAVNSTEANKRLHYLNADCAKYGYAGTPMQLKAETANKKIDKDDNYDNFCTPGVNYRYEIGRLSWLQSKWVDALRQREDGAPAYQSPSEIEEASRRSAYGSVNTMEIMDHTYSEKTDDPFRDNPRPSFEDVGFAYLAGAKKLCAEQDPEHVLEAADSVLEHAKTGSLLAQSAQNLKTQTIASHAMTMENFMQQAEPILADAIKTQKREVLRTRNLRPKLPGR